MLTPHNIIFFESPSQFREWLETYSAREKEIWVGFHKKDSEKPTLTWSQSVDQALCFGWIDGIRKSIDKTSYTIRFTPRNPKSIWSAVNIKKIEDLTKCGLMKPSGLKVFETRKIDNSKIYSFEQAAVSLPEPFMIIFQKNPKAWEQFSAMPTSYKKTATWWVISAKQESTRLKRLHTLINDSENGQRIALLRR